MPRIRAVLIVLGASLATGVAGAPSAEAHFRADCKTNKCKRHVIKPHRAHLKSMAYCESRLQWHIDGQFDGGLQFSPGTWNATGSSYAFAYQAPPLEQKYRAVVWASKIGWAWRSTAGWPVCG